MATHLVRKFSPALKTFRRAQRNGPELFVKRISWVTGASELTSYFSQFGKVSNITLPFNLKTGLHKGFAFISFENSDFYENIKKFEGRHIIDDEEVICSLTSEEKSLLSHGASTMQLNRRINENSYGIDISKTNSDNEVFEFIRNEENGKEKKIKFSTPKLICRNSIDFQVHKKGAKEANLLHKLRKVSDSGEESGRGSGLSDSASSKKNSRVTTTTKRDQKYLNDGSSFSEGLNNCSYQSIK